MYEFRQFDALKVCCTDKFGQALTYCDFSQFVTFDDFGNLVPNTYNDTTKTWCANKVVDYAMNYVWETTNDVYNSYQDCYNYSSTSPATQVILVYWKTEEFRLLLQREHGNT